ncbi:cyclophilin-like domain-containing protein [Glomus cerebriforme]|uniref:Cyclophilin-like domain-containing protein n=1 Tax=Glomus cerebriforme TaxID=658196 RepID=A0A397TFM8_9GLOM|nr:cyclophilin-like domain-containing protein [Glomus cerebriforme]
MGKGTDKMYITHSEWSGEFGGMQFGGIQARKKTEVFKRLPFYCCSLSLQPFEHPVCTPDGTIFDLRHIRLYLKKFGINPVTGEKLGADSLISLNFFKNPEGEYHCPVTFKVFSDHTHIVAIKTTGNVYAYEAVDRLNIKTKHWKDLLSEDPFTRKDIITLQDPHNLEARNLSNFYYLKNNLKLKDDESSNDSLSDINLSATGSAGRILSKISGRKDESVDHVSAEDKPLEKSLSSTPFIRPKSKNVPYNAASYSRGLAAASFTSTAMTPVTENENALVDEEEFMFKEIKEKGYARIMTNLGSLNIELFCDKAPRTCYNFIMLSKQGYYNGTIFHRKIKNFMIQGGDPTGTGKGGESYWKKDFADEFKRNLSHNERGLMSMANKGKNTNSSQFFFTFRPCTHLDNKHTIFGKIVGGKEILDKMESIPTDESDRPLQEIKIVKVITFVDPYEEYKKKLEKKLSRQNKNMEKKPREKTEKDTTTWFGTKLVLPGTKESINDESRGVGKYLKSTTSSTSKKRNFDNDEFDTEPIEKKPKVTGYNFGDFNSW